MLLNELYVNDSRDVLEYDPKEILLSFKESIILAIYFIFSLIMMLMDKTLDLYFLTSRAIVYASAHVVTFHDQRTTYITFFSNSVLTHFCNISSHVRK